MYVVYYSDDVYQDAIVYASNSFDEGRVISSAKITYELNKSGSFEFTVNQSNNLYYDFKLLVGKIRVVEGTKTIWMGRIASIDRDFYGEKTIFCEGLMALFNDVIVEPTNPNASGDEAVQITDVFDLTMTALNTLYEGKEYGLRMSYEPEVFTDKKIPHNTADYSQAMDILQSEILDANIAYSIVRYDDEQTPRAEVYYFINAPKFEDNAIEFGKNLLDINETLDASDIFTILLPIGKEDITIANVNEGSKYLYVPELQEQYGDIYKMVDFSDADTPERLLELANDYKRDLLERITKIDANAIDLERMSVDTAAMQVGTMIHILSIPHGIDGYSLCSKIELDILNPEQSQYSFGLYRDIVTGSVADAHASIATTTINLNMTNHNLTVTNQNLEQTNEDLRVTRSELEASIDDLRDDMDKQFDDIYAGHNSLVEYCHTNIDALWEELGSIGGPGAQ